MDADKQTSVKITNTDRRGGYYGTRFFGFEADLQKSGYGFSTLFWSVGLMPIKPLKTFYLSRDDMNKQQWGRFEISGIVTPDPKYISAKEVPLRISQVQSVYLKYWGFVIIIMILASLVTHW